MKFLKVVAVMMVVLFVQLVNKEDANAQSNTFGPGYVKTGIPGTWVDLRGYSSLTTALAAIAAAGAPQVTLAICTEHTVAVNTTIPTNVALYFTNQGGFNVTAGTLTVSSRNIFAEDRSIFRGAGTINFAVGTQLRSSWFTTIDYAIAQTVNDTVSLVVSAPATFAASAAVGANVRLVFESPGNILTVPITFTLSNVDQVAAGKFQCFGGAGDFSFVNGPELRASWFDHLRSAVIYIGTDAVTLVNDLPEVLFANLVIPVTITFKIDQGAIIDLDAYNLTVSGTLDIGLYQAFNESGVGNVLGLIISRPQWWGAIGDDALDDTAAFDSAIAALSTYGGTFKTSPGVYLFDDVELPAFPKVVKIEGGGATYQPFSTNTCLFTAGTNDVRRWVLENCFIKAHASGSTGEAINLMNMRGALVSDIGWFSNGAGNFAIGIKLIASTHGCYGNVLERLSVHDQTGPTTFIDFQNGGIASGNANSNTISNLWVHGQATGMTEVIDGVRSGKVEVSGCTIEGNLLATAIIPGTMWNIHDNWFELNLLDIDAQTVAGGESNGVSFRDNFIGGLTPGVVSTIDLDANLRGWEIRNNRPEANLVVTDASAHIYNIVQLGSIYELANVQSRFEWHNTAAGGGRWAWLIMAAGGPFPGDLALMDVDNTTYPFIITDKAMTNSLIADATGPRTYGIWAATPATITVADNGVGTPAAATITLTTSSQLLVCNDADGCAITLSEASVPAGGAVNIMHNGGTGVATFATVAGVQQTNGGGVITLSLYDCIPWAYSIDRWVQSGPYSNN